MTCKIKSTTAVCAGYTSADVATFTCPDPSSCGEPDAGSLTTGVIVLISVLSFFLMLAIIIVFLVKRKRKRTDTALHRNTSRAKQVKTDAYWENGTVSNFTAMQ